jgi:plasmid stabilization system protein ParE
VAAVRLSREALADLLGIANHTLSEWGASQAAAYIAELEQVMDRLAGNPLAAPAVPELGPRVRRRRHASHTIFFRPGDEGILVLAILNVRQDPFARFEAEPG